MELRIWEFHSTGKVAKLCPATHSLSLHTPPKPGPVNPTPLATYA